MIKLYIYNALPDEEKAEILWRQGTYLTTRSQDHFRINLHSLSNFFLEEWYDIVQNEIVRFRTFRSKSQLEVYLYDVDLVKLINGFS